MTNKQFEQIIKLLTDIKKTIIDIEINTGDFNDIIRLLKDIKETKKE